MKNKTVAILLSLFFGYFGVDRFYLGYTTMGAIKLVTGGGFGVLWLVDFIRLLTGSLKPADGSDWVS